MIFSISLPGGFSGSIKTVSALAVAILLSACASSDAWFKQADSSVPIEVIHSGTGRFMSYRAHETSDRLYVAGTAREHPLLRRAHVDIQLIDASGAVVAEKRDDIDPTRPAPGGGPVRHGSYGASFPLSDARRTAKIVITYHTKHQP